MLAAFLSAALLEPAQPGSASVAAPAGGPYARIAVLRPHDGRTIEFEAGYIRHLDWHRRANDSWTWYGWTVTYGERQRWFVYASFGHTAADLDRTVAPADDERDNILNVVPHAEFAGNALFEFLPVLSRGSGVPEPTARLELTTVETSGPGAAEFEAALARQRDALQGETLWYRQIAGGAGPRFVRLRPRVSLAAIIGAPDEPRLPDAAARLAIRVSVEILTLRPTMSLGIER
jgi:hypothetical protein